jgi:hypothetical protein
VTSRKFTIFLFASIVIFRPWLLNKVHRSFLISSIWRGVALMPKPSSLYKPNLLSCFIVIRCSRKDPTNSQDSAPSKLLVVTSNRFDDNVFPQCLPELYKHDFFACKTIYLSVSVMLSYLDAKSNAAFRRSNEMDR